MSLQSLRENAPLLVSMPVDGIEFLESIATEVQFPKGAVVFDEDQPAEAFYLIATGKVGLEVSMPARDAYLIETLGPGELLGVSWLFPPHRWSWRARALVATDVIAFDAEKARRRCAKDPEFALHVYRTVAEEAVQRLHATRIRVLDLFPGWER